LIILVALTFVLYYTLLY